MAFAIFRVDSEIVKNELRKKISREKEIVRVSEQVFSGFEKKMEKIVFSQHRSIFPASLPKLNEADLMKRVPPNNKLICCMNSEATSTETTSMFICNKKNCWDQPNSNDEAIKIYLLHLKIPIKSGALVTFVSACHVQARRGLSPWSTAMMKNYWVRRSWVRNPVPEMW